MTGPASFVLLTGLGFIMLYLMQYTDDTLDAVLVRLAAVLFLGAGFVGASGVIGTAVHKAFVTSNTQGDAIARTALGSSVMYLVWLGLGLLWLLCFIPERWFSKAIPDWLSVLGLLLPTGVETIPGPVGKAMVHLMRSIATFVDTPVAALFGK